MTEKHKIYAITHEPTTMVYIGIAQLHEEGYMTTPFGDAIILFRAALPKLQPYDNFTVKVLDEAEDFWAAATTARQLVVRLKEHMPGKVINPVDGHVRGAVDTGINASDDTLQAKAKTRNIPHSTVYQRMKRGWSEEQALGMVPAPERVPGGGRKKRMVTIGDETRSYSEWCKLTGISIEMALARENRLGWTVERAVTTPKQRGKKA